MKEKTVTKEISVEFYMKDSLSRKKIINSTNKG